MKIIKYIGMFILIPFVIGGIVMAVFFLALQTWGYVVPLTYGHISVSDVYAEHGKSIEYKLNVAENALKGEK